MKPNFNMRSVKFCEDGASYTIESSSMCERKDVLCAHCGVVEKCKIAASLSRLERKHDLQVDLAPRRCRMFMPVLSFRPPFKGLDANFNTFRLGMAWGKRVVVGSHVALGDALTFDVFGYAQVTDVISGPLNAMLEGYAAANHTMLDVPPSEAPAALLDVLIKSYGKNWVNDGRGSTVIDLTRVDCRYDR